MNFIVDHILSKPKNSLWVMLWFLVMLGTHGLIYGFSDHVGFTKFYTGAALVSLFSFFLSIPLEKYELTLSASILYIIAMGCCILFFYVITKNGSWSGPRDVATFIFASCAIWYAYVMGSAIASTPTPKW